MNGGKQMDKKLKQALKVVYRAPDPVKKSTFLKQHCRREMGRWTLIAVQTRYIRWWTWVLSLALFGSVLCAVWEAAEAGLWSTAALTPFLALLAVTENGRSRLYNMDELELACRMSRQSVSLARMVVLGLFHLVLLAGLTPALAIWGAVGTARAGVYLLTPYLLTAAVGMELTRRFRGKEGLTACGGGAALVSALGLFLVNQRPALYQQSNLPLWMTVLAVATFAAAAEFKLNTDRMEEMQWN